MTVKNQNIFFCVVQGIKIDSFSVEEINEVPLNEFGYLFILPILRYNIQHHSENALN